MYEQELWAQLAKHTGRKPMDTESQCRSALEDAGEIILDLMEALYLVQGHITGKDIDEDRAVYLLQEAGALSDRLEFMDRRFPNKT